MAKLTINQLNALAQLRELAYNKKTGLTAGELGVSGSTLASLASQGIVTKGESVLRSPSYLITKHGRQVYKQAIK